MRLQHQQDHQLQHRLPAQAQAVEQVVQAAEQVAAVEAQNLCQVQHQLLTQSAQAQDGNAENGQHAVQKAHKQKHAHSQVAQIHHQKSNRALTLRLRLIQQAKILTCLQHRSQQTQSVLNKILGLQAITTMQAPLLTKTKLLAKQPVKVGINFHGGAASAHGYLVYLGASD